LSNARAPSFIDVHHHVVLPEYQHALARAGAIDPSRPLRANSRPEQVISAMESFGIDSGIVNPLSVAGVHHGSDEHANYLSQSVNEALSRFVEQSSNRLGFFAVLPLPDLDGALLQLQYAYDTLHADGIILLSNQDGKYIGDLEFEPLYKELNDRRAVVFVHPARPGYADNLKLKIWPAIVEYPAETTRVAANLIYNGVMKNFPQIRWILAHAGGYMPYIALRMQLMDESDDQRPTFKERHPEGVSPYLSKFWFDTAISASPAALTALQKIADPTRVLFGSDWPYISREYEDQQIEVLQEKSIFNDGEFSLLARENARALFPRFR
jgi:predicted TIM-barrel fold metal-dependent hydrolase